MSLRILFFGTSEFAVPSLESLVADHQDVIRCITQPDRPQGRGLTPQPSPVKAAALRLRVPVEEPERLVDALAEFKRLEPDLGVVVSYGRLIPEGLLRLPRHAILGMHPSSLPKYRGASPIAWAILHGEQATGVTIFRLNERLDAGDVLLHRPVEIGPRETAAELSDRLARLVAELLIEAVHQIEQGAAAFHPQDERLSTYAPKLSKADGRVDWTVPAVTIDRLVRAAVPWPGAYTEWRGQSLKLWRTDVNPQPPAVRGRPGEVVAVSGDGVVVAAGEGSVAIQEVQPPGRRRMTVREFLSGHPVRVGETFGEKK